MTKLAEVEESVRNGMLQLKDNLQSAAQDIPSLSAMSETLHDPHPQSKEQQGRMWLVGSGTPGR